MNAIITSALRLTALAAALTFVTASASAKSDSAADSAAQTLAINNRVAVKNAGPYVEVGTFRIQVAVKLGQPTAKLAGDTWLYQDYRVEDSAAAGALVVSFNKGRVSSLSLVTPNVATAMLRSNQSPDRTLVAQRN